MAFLLFRYENLANFWPVEGTGTNLGGTKHHFQIVQQCEDFGEGYNSGKPWKLQYLMV